MDELLNSKRMEAIMDKAFKSEEGTTALVEFCMRMSQLVLTDHFDAEMFENLLKCLEMEVEQCALSAAVKERPET